MLQTYYSCPCSDVSADPLQPKGQATARPVAEDDDEHTLKPYDARSDYALYPLEQLLFCIECHELRCPRCYYDEAVYYYCPSCLLETPSATLKAETNRCTRSCSQCPLCFAPLALQSYPDPDAPRPDASNPATKDGPFILSCPYCAWSTLEIGITLEKSININGQLKKVYAQQQNLTPASEDWPASPGAPDTRSRLAQETSADSVFDDDSSSADVTKRSYDSNQAASQDAFTALANFYKGQLADTVPSSQYGLSSAYGLDSPSQLSRLLSTFGVASVKKQRGKVPVMREALTAAEGLRVVSEQNNSDLQPRQHQQPSEAKTIQDLSYETRLSPAQLMAQQLHPHNPTPTTTALATASTATLRPIPTQLRAKRAKRCRTCRNILLRPDDKRQSTRYKIRLLAVSYVPRLTCSPLALPSQERARHFQLHFRNPLYEQCRITLATPASTKDLVGAPLQAKITILCPQFDVGATADTWTEALEGPDKASAGGGASTAGEDWAKDRVPEAGKVWARGRNWTAVVLELLPSASADHKSTSDRELEIPVFVRMEYESDDVGAGGASSSSRGTAAAATDATKADTAKEPKAGAASTASTTTRLRRELAYWCVVPLGRL